MARARGAARVIGIAANTSRLTPDAADRWLQATAQSLGLPAVDPLKDGVEPLVAAMLA